MTNLTDMLSKFVNANTASSSGSGSLPSNTVTNPKEDLKGITTRSGVAYQGPTIPTTSSSPKVVERETEVTKDTMLPTNNGSTKDVQPPVVQIQPHVPNSEPVVTPMLNPKPSISYPSRRNDERRREKANDQIEKFYEIFKDLSFKISLTNALILMPKFASTLKALIGNKEKLSEMARTPLNEHCSAVILNKLPEKLGDPGKFLIPCDFPIMDECLALADLGASINLMPLSVGKRLSLPELTPTSMTLELADRSITKPIGIAEDVSVKVADYEEIPEGGIPRVIVLGYDGLPLQPVAPPSPDFILGPENPQTLPVPQDEDEREPMFIQAHDPNYVPEPIYPEYIPLEDNHEFPAEEQPLPPVDSPTAESPGYITEKMTQELEKYNFTL
ncbi:reverse transcriptase domain-containing protein [Tanacetum coccineum]